MEKLLIATKNLGKVWKFKDMLSDLPLEIVSVSELDLNVEVDENMPTVEGNAERKATAYAQASGLVSLSEDTGLEIDALGGKPGVQARRWNGELLERITDKEWRRFCLGKMEGIPFEKRTARMPMAAAVSVPNGRVYIVRHEARFIIAEKPFKEETIGGFPFRSLMYFPKYGKAYHELTKQQLHEVLRKGYSEEIRKILKQLYNFPDSA